MATYQDVGDVLGDVGDALSAVYGDDDEAVGTTGEPDDAEEDEGIPTWVWAGGGVLVLVLLVLVIVVAAK